MFSLKEATYLAVKFNIGNFEVVFNVFRIAIQ